jgi:hypothetical protein
VATVADDTTQHTIVPNPDPSSLTTAAMLREVENARAANEVRAIGIEHRVECAKEILETRLSALDKAILLLQNNLDRAPSASEMHAKFEEKFKSVDIQFGGISTQFKERDTRTEQLSIATTTAIAAALQAAEKAVGKQQESSAALIEKNERSTTKQIDAIVDMMKISQKASEDKFTDMKDRNNAIETRITTIEGRTIGADRIEKRQHEGWGLIVGGIMMVIAFGTLIVMLVGALQKAH